MSVLVALALWAAVTFAQQPTAEGANLFAPSVQAGKEIDAERALPTTRFYRPPTSGTTAKPGTLVRSEPATDFALPPGHGGSARVPRHVEQRNRCCELGTGSARRGA